MLQLASPVLRPGFVGCASLAEAARLLMSGRLPDVVIALDGEKLIARAAPMVDSRFSIVRGLNDVLARMVTLLVDTADNYLKGQMIRPGLPRASAKDKCPTNGQIVGAYFLSAMPRLAAGAVRRLGFHINRWRVSYRFHNGETVAATGLLAGEHGRTCPTMAAGSMPTRLRSSGRDGISSSWRTFVTVAPGPSYP